jgi:small subunit ribosomal protein S15
MGRMYSRKRGKSGSRRPALKGAKWVTHKPQEVEEIVAKLAKEGRSSAETGLMLRDQYGIPSARLVTKKKVYGIMREGQMNSDLPEDMLNLLRSAVKLMAHLEKNSHDRYCKRGLELTESKIRRLTKYYKNNHILPENWNYDPEKAKLLVK